MTSFLQDPGELNALIDDFRTRYYSQVHVHRERKYTRQQVFRLVFGGARPSPDSTFFFLCSAFPLPTLIYES